MTVLSLSWEFLYRHDGLYIETGLWRPTHPPEQANQITKCTVRKPFSWAHARIFGYYMISCYALSGYRLHDLTTPQCCGTAVGSTGTTLSGSHIISSHLTSGSPVPSQGSRWTMADWVVHGSPGPRPQHGAGWECRVPWWAARPCGLGPPAQTVAMSTHMERHL